MQDARCGGEVRPGGAGAAAAAAARAKPPLCPGQRWKRAVTDQQDEVEAWMRIHTKVTGIRSGNAGRAGRHRAGRVGSALCLCCSCLLLPPRYCGARP
jgi:hypothetical protein